MTKTLDTAARIQELKRLPYHRELICQEDGTWFAQIVEFPGCMTVGTTQIDALSMLDDAMTEWLSVMIEDGSAIPPPMRAEQFSGKFQVRVPKSLHRELVCCAQREGVSLNQYVLSALSATVGSARNVEPRWDFGAYSRYVRWN